MTAVIQHLKQMLRYVIDRGFTCNLWSLVTVKFGDVFMEIQGRTPGICVIQHCVQMSIQAMVTLCPASQGTCVA